MIIHPGIEHDHQALTRILAALIAMAGLAGDAPTIGRRLRGAVLGLLRPAEAATRRLIIALSRTLRAPRLAPQRPRKPQTPYLRDGIGTGIIAPVRVPFRSMIPIFAMAAKAKAVSREANASRPLAFQLLDPLRNPLRHRRSRRCQPHRAPRIIGLGPDDPPPASLPKPPSPTDRIDAANLGRRLAALGEALGDLPAQARRFKRWQALNARRDSLPADRRARSRRLSPLRMGRPPGSPPRHASQSRAAHEVYEVLAHAHSMALDALERRRDTS